MGEKKILNKKIYRIIKDVSLRTGIPYDVVDRAWRAQFECARKYMEEGVKGDPSTFYNIRFKYLGLLYANPRKVLKIHENGNGRRSNKNKESDNDRGG